MKNLFYTLTLLCISLGAAAQQIGFTYQAVALDESKAEGFGRDSKGQVLLNQALKVRFTIREHDVEGAVQYQEVHQTTTDIFGIFRVVIGAGEKLQGTSLEELRWSDQSYYMQVEVDLGNGLVSMGTEVIVVPPFGLNNTIQLLNLAGTQLSISDGNSVDLSNLLGSVRLSEQEVDAYVANNGYLLTEVDGSTTNELQNLSSNGTPGHLAITQGNELTINVNDADADPTNEIQVLSKSGNDVTLSNGGGTISIADNDNDSQNEIQDLQLSGNQLIITNNPTPTIINLSPYLGNNLTEQDVDNMVANNGYLITEVDGSVTNEIQDLAIANDVLSITNNPAPTTIDLTPYRNVFEITNNVTSNENGNYATDDFVFGSPSANDDGDANHASRFFFDKSSSAFRAGYSSFLAWDESLFPFGEYSLGIGYMPIATGTASIALGSGTGATGNYSIAMGNQSIASAEGAMSMGASNNVSGLASMGFGNNNLVPGAQSFALGNNNQILFGAHHAFVLGSNSIASAPYGLALGHATSASGEESTAIGFQAAASNLRSMALGYYSSASAPEGVAIGSQVNSTGFRSTALGFANVSSGQDSRALGTGVESFSYGETALGLWNTPYTISQSGLLFNNTDRLLSVGNGHDSNNRSDALVMFKNGYTRLHGQLTIDADNINGAGEQYTLPGQDGAANQVMTTDGNGNVSWNTPTTLTESDVDNFVSNDGYLTTEVDGSITNEIQDLNLIGNTLTITNNSAATNIDLSPYQNVFVRNNGVISNGNGNYAIDDFVFGSPSKENSGNNLYNNRMYYDKSRGAFRAGGTTGSIWQGNYVGNYSIGLGYQAVASGSYSVSLGEANIASGSNAIALGRLSVAQGSDAVAIGMNTRAIAQGSMAFGYNVEANSSYSAAFGFGSDALGTYSISMGYYSVANSNFSNAIGTQSTANGSYSNAIGNRVIASSASETVLGSYNSTYVPNSTTSYNINDRLFVIGNGAASNSRSNALVMLKNGNTRLHGQLTIDADNVNGAGESYTLPGQRGTNGQVMMTDGSGNVSWTTPAALVEVDGSVTNEIQDLAIANDVLTITNNATPTQIDLAPYRNVFETTSNVTSNENGDYANDSFIFGSAQLDDDNATTDDNTRMLFEKSTGAFRVGTVTDTRWDAAERGANSVAMGLGNIARGSSSLSLGQNNLAHSASSVAIGTNNQAEGYNSIALGRNVATTGVHSMGLSLYSASRSYGETTMGIYAADYVPNSTTNFDASDRLFTIGNGLDDGNRSNALVIFKNGDANLNGLLTIDADNYAAGQAYTLPGQDGFSGQLLITDGAGHASWSNVINGDLTVTGFFSNTSDSRLKRNIAPLKNSLFHLTALNGFHYNWNNKTMQDTLALQTGLIAQEVEAIFPELVKTDEEGFKSVNYIGLVPHLIEAIKELKAENERLKSDTEKTKASTEERIAAMEARIMKIEALAEKANR